MYMPLCGFCHAAAQALSESATPKCCRHNGKKVDPDHTAPCLFKNFMTIYVVTRGPWTTLAHLSKQLYYKSALSQHFSLSVAMATIEKNIKMAFSIKLSYFCTHFVSLCCYNPSITIFTVVITHRGSFILYLMPIHRMTKPTK